MPLLTNLKLKLMHDFPRTAAYMGELAYGFVQRILYRGSSLKFTSFFSSNSR